MCNTSSRPQLFYTAIALSIQFIPRTNSVLIKSTAYSSLSTKGEWVPCLNPKFSVRVMNHTREGSAPLALQPKLRNGHGSCRAVDKAVRWALLAPSIPNSRSASCRTWPMAHLSEESSSAQVSFHITSNQTAPESTFLTTEQLKEKLPNQHPSIHSDINLNRLTD